MPQIIDDIEKHFNLKLSLSTANGPEAFMRYGRKESSNEYLLEGDHLIALKLRTNGLQDFPFLSRPELQSLQALHLAENDLHSLKFSEGFAALQYLDISDNPNLAEVTFPENTVLTQLTLLEASDSGLTSLHLPECPNLEHIDISRNKLEQFVFTSGCPELKWLDLSGNEVLRELSVKGRFPKLESIYLNKCALEQLTITNALPALRVLDLEDNQLQSWPTGFLIPDTLETLYLNGNFLKDIPETIIGSGERHNSVLDVRSYLQSMVDVEQVGFLHQAKLILVGNGEVGKSSIRIKLIDETAPLPEEEDRTPGLDISITPYVVKDLPPEVTGLEKPIDFQLNIWDFGGQSRYREVQQLFCSPKSLYLFVTSPDDQPKKNEDYVSFEYWMAMVHALSYEKDKSSPVIHVVNKIDQGRRDINQIQRNQLGNIKRWREISCLRLTNLDLLRKDINEVLPIVSDDIFRDRFHKEWLKVKDTLQEQYEKNHITLEEYFEICAPALNETDALTWLRTLDRIGSVIYFSKNDKREDSWIILNPNWVKQAIFDVLDSGLVNPLTKGTIDIIWRDYTPEERMKLLALMIDYDLCYIRKNNFDENEYVVPSLLKEEQPNLAQFGFEKLPVRKLRFRYLQFLPAGTVNKLIVKANQQIFQGLMWKNNVILRSHESTDYAHIRESWQDHSIYITLYGDNPYSLYSLIKSTVETLNTEFKDAKFLKKLEMQIDGDYKNKWQEESDLEDFNVADFSFLWGAIDNLEIQDKNAEMEEIYQLIKRNKITAALQKMKEVLPTEAHEEIIQLEARLERLERNERMGVISFDEANRERARITSAILDLTKSYKEPRASPKPDSPKSPPLPKSDKKKVLFLCSSPNGKNPLDFGRAFRQIEEARQVSDHRDNFEEIEIKTGVNRRELLRLLTKHQPDILHISLHSSKTKGLYFENKIGDEDPIDAEGFAKMIQTYCRNPRGKKKIEVMVLDACNTKDHGEAVVAYADYVICTQDFYPDEAGIRYAEEFYHLIFELNDIQYAHEAAVTAIEIEGFETPENVSLPIHEIPLLLKH